MFNMKITTLVMLFLMLKIPLEAQIDIDPNQYKNTFAFDPVIVVDLAGNVSKGVFLELKGDSLTMILNSRVETVAINSIKHFKLFARKKDGNNVLNLGLAGAFAAQLLLSKRDWQSDRFIQSEGIWPHILIGALGAVGGGLIGLGVDLAGNEREMEYNLQDAEDVQKMKRDINELPHSSKVNFYYEIAKVYARTDPAGNQSTGSYYNYEKVTLNVFRSIKLTYELNPRLEAGLALYSAAEPNIKFSYYSQSSYGNEDMANRVYGYYAMALYDLLGPSNRSSFSLKPGLGVGFVNLDYTISRYKSVYDPVTYSYKTTYESSNLNKTLFSGFLSIDASFLTTSGVSIAVTGDYVFIPEKTLPSNLVGEGGKSFSNFSLGLSLGLHF